MTEHSRDFEKIRGFYDRGFWKAVHVRAAVGKKITAEEYTEITGEPLTASGTETGGSV